MIPDDEVRMERAAAALEEPVTEAAALARKLGLAPYPVNYWIVDYDDMNELIAYGGFQDRYPHWRWGMQYDRQQKQGQFLGGKAFEIVNNDDPAHAFLQESNAVADQKAVITHVEAHADFFANNQWFGLFTDRAGRAADSPRGGRTPDAAAMLARHAETIEGYMQDPDIDRSEVERWIDHVLCLEDNIDQHSPYVPVSPSTGAPSEVDDEELGARLEDLAFSEDVTHHVFDEDWLAEQAADADGPRFPAEPEADLLGFLRRHGKQYDAEAEKAAAMTDWQADVLDILRREAYYFAPQKMTKVMNEGWAALWESVMMGEEGFAGDDEFVTYADHQARVLSSSGLNPYKLGKELWEYVENTTNRRHVAELLLRVEGVTWRNFHETVDFGTVQEVLAPDAAVAAIDPDRLDALDPADPRVDGAALADARAGDIDVGTYPWQVLTYEGLAERHFSLTKPQYRGFLAKISRSDLEQISRYLFEDAKYASVTDALADVDYTTGWDRMREIRESHNDVTFLDEFLTQEFVDENEYFTYEWVHAAGEFQVTSTDYEDVKKKLLLQFTNFGKPTIVVADGNYRNRNELRLDHLYNGIQLDLEKAKNTLERVFELWGRGVALRTIVKRIDERDREVAQRRDREPDPDEVGLEIRYDGMEFTERELDWQEVDHLAATDVDYDTKPADWLA